MRAGGEELKLQVVYSEDAAFRSLFLGRYLFEVRLLEVMAPLEDPNARTRVPQPRSQLRIGG